MGGGDGKNHREKTRQAAAKEANSLPPPSSSTSTRLLLFMAPLVLVSVMLAVLGPKSLDWDFKFQSLWAAGSPSRGSLNSNTEVDGGVSPTSSPIKSVDETSVRDCYVLRNSDSVLS
uniref:Uncharacterized protein n=1 Tax=Kalanchoe fedtschenkoi TaxID=63787 RepID=A0A7N0ZZJ9_KALFE